jgi:hypothetical protein
VIDLWEFEMSARITIRLFVEEDTPEVRDLFISVNRQLAPPDLYDAFEDYITRALAEEINRTVSCQTGVAA